MTGQLLTKHFMFYWSKELLIDGCVFLHLINWWHILYCKTTKVPHHANVEQLFICLIRGAHSMLMLMLNIELALFLHSSLSGVFLVFLYFCCYHVLLLPSKADLQHSAHSMQSFIKKHQHFIKEWKQLCVFQILIRPDIDSSTNIFERL